MANKQKYQKTLFDFSFSITEGWAGPAGLGEWVRLASMYTSCSSSRHYSEPGLTACSYNFPCKSDDFWSQLTQYKNTTKKYIFF